MNFPKCLSEAETLERAIAGQNLARFGDGEFSIARGGHCVSQKGDKSLAKELRDILEKAPSGCLPCLPDPYGGTPKKANWQKFEKADLKLGDQQFGSAFISRPDSAPWIDTPEYWQRMRTLWAGKDVTLVLGSQRSLRSDMIADAASVREVWGTYRDAYDARGIPSDKRNHPDALLTVDELIEAVGKPSGPVLLCLGPTATVMAARLAARGVYAVDLGHLGLFMRSAGAYRYKLDDLISPEYRSLLLKKHASGTWGADGDKHADAVLAYADELEAETILDYGCGEMKLAEALKGKRRVSGFDPGVTGREGMPKPCDLVVCTDMLEHAELDRLNDVFGHIRSICLKGAYFVISTKPAKAILSDGRNAHLIVHPALWWLKGLQTAGFKIIRDEVVGEKEVRIWALK